MELTIDELAGRAELPVRTLREYHTMRLLPPPERRGRVGVYGMQHVERLALIGRLQRRGYSLAGIKDLLAAWEAGADLTTLLGVDSGPATLDEAPLRITTAELHERLPELASAAAAGQAVAAGLLVPLGEEHFLVRSPALLALVADGVRAGVPLAAMLAGIASLTGGIGALADEFAGHVIEQIVPPLLSAGDPEKLPGLLQRWRVLLPQGVASILADRVGSALLEKADGDAGEQLRAAIGRIRIGATTDTGGTIRRYRP
jgi:DNA-binding transcriptional MerR regulator